MKFKQSITQHIQPNFSEEKKELEALQQESSRVIRNKKNKNTEILKNIPEINKIISTLKQTYWIEEIIYSADQRLESNFDNNTFIFVESWYDEILSHLRTITDQLKKYPEWALFPKRLCLYDQIWDLDKYKKSNDKEWFLEKITLLWLYNYDIPGTLFLSNWYKTTPTAFTIAWTFHHELFHMYDAEHKYFWQTLDHVSSQMSVDIWYPTDKHSSEYSYKNENEWQAELAKFLYLKMDHLLEIWAFELIINWESNIITQIEMITWYSINKKTLLDWSRRDSPETVFGEKIDSTLYTQRFWTKRLQYYGNRMNWISKDHRTKLLKQWLSYNLKESDKNKLQANRARLYFWEIIIAEKKSLDSIYQQKPFDIEAIAVHIASIFNATYIPSPDRPTIWYKFYQIMNTYKNYETNSHQEKWYVHSYWNIKTAMHMINTQCTHLNDKQKEKLILLLKEKAAFKDTYFQEFITNIEED